MTTYQLSELFSKNMGSQAGVQFLKKNRNKLIESIVAVKPIADELLQFIGHHKYDMILQAPTEYEQKRQLFNITQKGGEKLQIEFYKCLLKHEKYLVEDLKD
ncbi:apoptosis-associated speck-like protein containing a CARD [Silurus asotus]|uniref:Apoptosis-associated speck-like protein containing a CARD n=1 Tax=Silurus asotus TaxID=30991 RepID=A0AAD5AX71_SILAS|nr:apoptosis-associated speck-like protein containing a CARD [Silurus asotus]